MKPPASNPRVITLNEQEILEDAVFNRELEKLAAAMPCSPEELHDRARLCLKELAVRPEARYLDRVARLARFMYTRSYEPDIDTNHTELERLRVLVEQHPLVFLWSHKSHLDSFVFLRAIYDSGFRPQPLSFAGINMAFTGFARLAKRSGAIFLRRSFKDDPVYTLVFKHYIDYLVTRRASLSWSIEGTRSRTGKLMPPRLGLLKWVTDAYLRASRDDILLVPVSISFDQIAEMDDFIAMQQGLPKRKESLGWFLGYITGMKARSGKIHVRFAEPVAFSEAVDAPAAMFTDGGSERQVQVQKIAFEVCRRIEHATPITLTNIVSIVLLAANEQALTELQIRKHASQIAALAGKRALPTAGDLLLDCQNSLAGHLHRLCASGLLQGGKDGRNPVYRITPGKQLAAAYYRNTVVHYFLGNAIAEMALVAAAPHAQSAHGLKQSALELRDLFKFEFFFNTRKAFLADIETYLDERYRQWRTCTDTEGALFATHAPLFGHGILRNFIEAYQVLAQALQDKAGSAITRNDEVELLQHCQTLGPEMLLHRKIASAAALSKPLFANAVKLAQHRGLLQGAPGDLERGRAAFAGQLAAAASAVNHLQHNYDQQKELTCAS